MVDVASKVLAITCGFSYKTGTLVTETHIVGRLAVRGRGANLTDSL